MLFMLAASFFKGKFVGLKAQCYTLENENESHWVFSLFPCTFCGVGWSGVKLGSAFSSRFRLAQWEPTHMGAMRNPEKEEWTYSEEYKPLDSALGSCSHTWSFSVSSKMALPEA